MRSVCTIYLFDFILSIHLSISFIRIFVKFAATAFVVTCMTTMISQYGKHDQKGTVLGIFRSLGALARALGPTVACIGKLFS